MTMLDLRELLGSAGQWIVSLAIALFTGVALLAFAQGRSISIWPPRIGPRLWATSSAGRREAGISGRVPGDKNAAVDRQYDVAHARDFYQEIAASYDLRNSGNLVSTHLATVARLQEIRADRTELRVLDLGDRK